MNIKKICECGFLPIWTIFNNMDYKKIYDKIIERAKGRKLDGYFEKHHVVPKCVGGTNKKHNIVSLTAREHFICHWLLHKMFPNNSKLSQSFSMMCLVKSDNQLRYTPSSRIVEYSKKELSKAVSGENNPKFWKGKKGAWFGKKHSEETKESISKKLKGHLVSKETRKKISDKNKNQIPWNKGKKLHPLSDSHKEKISLSNKGRKNKPLSNEMKEKIRQYQLVNSSSAKKIVQKDRDGNVINIFNSIKEARNKTGVSRILDGVKGRKEYVKGFKWEYYDI